MPEDGLGIGDLTRERLTDLRLKIVEHFDDEELRTLCFDVDVDYDNLRGQGKEGKARELIDFMQRQGRLGDLIDACRKTRPRVDWNFDAAADVPPVKLPDMPKPPPQAGFLPLSRWQMQVSDGTAWIIDFYPNGVFAGLGIGAWWGAGAQAGGGWSFFIQTQTLQMQGVRQRCAARHDGDRDPVATRQRHHRVRQRRQELLIHEDRRGVTRLSGGE